MKMETKPGGGGGGDTAAAQDGLGPQKLEMGKKDPSLESSEGAQTRGNWISVSWPLEPQKRNSCCVF